MKKPISKCKLIKKTRLLHTIEGIETFEDYEVDCQPKDQTKLIKNALSESTLIQAVEMEIWGYMNTPKRKRNAVDTAIKIIEWVRNNPKPNEVLEDYKASLIKKK